MGESVGAFDLGLAGVRRLFPEESTMLSQSPWRSLSKSTPGGAHDQGRQTRRAVTASPSGARGRTCHPRQGQRREGSLGRSPPTAQAPASLRPEVLRRELSQAADQKTSMPFSRLQPRTGVSRRSFRCWRSIPTSARAAVIIDPDTPMSLLEGEARTDRPALPEFSQRGLSS